ncbi:MAG TPA: hemerythrin, partial [Thauera aminoaromatica]|nr:hemerythrin [Thauera aminoaromatica]
MTSPPVFTWSDRFLLGHRTIDDTHREFVDCVDALLRASDAEIPAALDA